MRQRVQDASLAGVALVLGTLGLLGATIIGVLLALPESQNPAVVLTIIFGFLSTQVPAMTGAILGRRANEKLDRVLNGEMDRKIVGGVHTALDQRDDEHRPQHRREVGP